MTNSSGSFLQEEWKDRQKEAVRWRKQRDEEFGGHLSYVPSSQWAGAKRRKWLELKEHLEAVEYEPTHVL